MLITKSILTDLCIAVATLIIAAYVYIKYKYSYWTRRGLPQLTPTFPFGNYFKGLPRGIFIGGHTIHFYNAFKKSGDKIGGVYLGLRPYLVVTDPVYARNIFTRDFSHFVNRGIYINKNKAMTVNLLSQEENEWRNARNKFSGMFTSAKMKFFFNTMKESIGDLKLNLESQSKDDKDVNIYEVMGCYFTDVTGSVIFGIEANSFKNPDAVFRKVGRDLFTKFSLRLQFELFLAICYPEMARKLGISGFLKEFEDFFYKFVPDAVEYRRKNNIYRADFLQVLLELKESGVNLTTQEMVAQSSLFFTAGYETSSATSMFTLFELGLHPDIQNKVREEINAIFKKYNEEFTYESLQEMHYLTKAIYESMRKYPLLTTINRECVKEYKFPDSDVVIEKGVGIILPVLGYHRNPEVFPDPMKWDPERFDDKNVKYDGYFPFGDGPRNCIGLRLGTMQVKLGLAEIIRNYEISVSPNTKLPLEIDERTFVTRTTETVLLRLKKITY